MKDNLSTLPAEVVIEIFSRLPLKSIARCRCVCKLWSSMLRSQDFTDLFSTKSSARPQLLFACSDHRVGKFIFFTSPQPENPEENSNVVVATNHLAPFPLSDVFYGSTNGFFCYEAERIFEGMEAPVFNPVVCNPNAGQSLALPTLDSRDRHGAKSYLGYDPIGKEFKVLSTLRTFANDEWVVVKHQVLTLGTDDFAWRSVECCVTHSYSSKWICIGGVIYYATSVDSSRYSMVACFDLRTEKFTFVEFLETFSKEMHHSTTLVNYCGKLGLIMSLDSGFVTGECTSFEMWVLEDAAKHEWSKHVYVLPPSWKDVVTEVMYIAGMVGESEIVFPLSISTCLRMLSISMWRGRRSQKLES